MKNFALLGLSLALCSLALSPVRAQETGLKQAAFEDGTGSIGLPPGWKLDGAYKGACQCVGPNGAAVILKMPWTIMVPGALPGLPVPPTQPVAPPGDILNGLREVLRKKTGSTLKTVRASRTTDVSAGTPAFYLLYEYTQNGKAMTGMGYFAPLTYPGQPIWQLYSSAIVAPTAEFAKQARTMLLMWKSWRPNGLPPREGSSSAIFDQIIKEKQDHYDQIQKDFREVVLGDAKN